MFTLLGISIRLILQIEVEPYRIGMPCQLRSLIAARN